MPTAASSSPTAASPPPKVPVVRNTRATSSMPVQATMATYPRTTARTSASPQIAQPGRGVGQERRSRPRVPVRAGQGRQEPEQGCREDEAGRVHQQDPAHPEHRQQPPPRPAGRGPRRRWWPRRRPRSPAPGRPRDHAGTAARDAGWNTWPATARSPTRTSSSGSGRQPQGDHHHQGALDQLAGDHHPPPVQPVGHRPGERAQQRRGEVAGQQQRGHGQGLPGGGGHVQHEGDQAEGVPQEGHRPGAPQQAEGPVRASSRSARPRLVPRRWPWPRS